ncbi:hypothetical protein NDU88_005499 [Pleurodeles waltl]|uniref:Uncharacterized protein n=1 Tax=Pleurodeles waltl TaxID=8319 RepID=A0AAV7L0Y7_PLEWA|nr:hypothetical protein NDU88_005499 [Pleurodeles waltl]
MRLCSASQAGGDAAPPLVLGPAGTSSPHKFKQKCPALTDSQCAYVALAGLVLMLIRPLWWRERTRWSELSRPGLWNRLMTPDQDGLWGPTVTPGVVGDRGPRNLRAPAAELLGALCRVSWAGERGGVRSQARRRP